MHAFAISKISFRLLLSFTHETPNGFGKYIRCDNELNRFMSVHSWVQLHGTFSPIFKKKNCIRIVCMDLVFSQSNL